MQRVRRAFDPTKGRAKPGKLFPTPARVVGEIGSAGPAGPDHRTRMGIGADVGPPKLWNKF